MTTMLPPRAYAEPLAPFSANLRAQPSPSDARPALIVAVAAADVDRFPSSPYARFVARTTIEAVRLIERWRPRVIVVDWDLPEFDANAISVAARQVAPVGLLAVMAEAQRAPCALKAGCHAILLKPFSVNLTAARLGRLCREMPAAAAATRLGAPLQQWGTNRTWPDVKCPKCDQAGAVCFEYSSHRRSWYACLGCEQVWLGARRE
jgi:CheY-like chemotaxis protein